MKDFKIRHFDDRRNLLIGHNTSDTLHQSAHYILKVGREAIQEKGFFTLALSGGSTPKAIFEILTAQEHVSLLDWTKVKLFWSDERPVPPNHHDSNFNMAMQAGFSCLPIPSDNIHRMVAEEHIEENAHRYEKLIHKEIPTGQFDLIMLGMGSDGHTASLFPHTKGLHSTAWVTANFIPHLKTYRMTFTYELINQAHFVMIVALGPDKKEMVQTVLKSPFQPDTYPIQKIGTPLHKALWILDPGSAGALCTS